MKYCAAINRLKAPLQQEFCLDCCRERFYEFVDISPVSPQTNQSLAWQLEPVMRSILVVIRIWLAHQKRFNETKTGPTLTGTELDRHADKEEGSPMRAKSTHSNRFKQTPCWHWPWSSSSLVADEGGKGTEDGKGGKRKKNKWDIFSSAELQTSGNWWTEAGTFHVMLKGRVNKAPVDVFENRAS